MDGVAVGSDGRADPQSQLFDIQRCRRRAGTCDFPGVAVRKYFGVGINYGPNFRALEIYYSISLVVLASSI